MKLLQDPADVAGLRLVAWVQLFEQRAYAGPQHVDLVGSQRLRGLSSPTAQDQVEALKLEFDVVTPAHEEGMDQVVLVMTGGSVVVGTAKRLVASGGTKRDRTARP